jgi:hypothetical protein
VEPEIQIGRLGIVEEARAIEQGGERGAGGLRETERRTLTELGASITCVTSFLSLPRAASTFAAQACFCFLEGFDGIHWIVTIFLRHAGLARRISGDGAAR